MNSIFGSGKSWQTTIGGIICLAGGAVLLYKMIFGSAPIDEMHLALLGVCLGAGGGLLRAKDENVHTLPDGTNMTMTKQ